MSLGKHSSGKSDELCSLIIGAGGLGTPVAKAGACDGAEKGITYRRGGIGPQPTSHAYSPPIPEDALVFKLGMHCDSGLTEV